MFLSLIPVGTEQHLNRTLVCGPALVLTLVSTLGNEIWAERVAVVALEGWAVQLPGVHRLQLKFFFCRRKW